jgi:hypothetical protein
VVYNVPFNERKGEQLKIESTYELNAATSTQSQLINDDFVDSLAEISSFFMPQGVVAVPVEYVNDYRKSLVLESNIVLAEIMDQQIFECNDRLSIRLSGKIIEGFTKPRKFSFLLSHSNLRAKVFTERDHIQTFRLSEFLRLEYSDIPLIVTDTIFGLNFLDFNKDDEPASLTNGSGCLLFGEEVN